MERKYNHQMMPKNHFRKFNHYEKLIFHNLKSYYRTTIFTTFGVVAQLKTTNQKNKREQRPQLQVQTSTDFDILNRSKATPELKERTDGAGKSRCLHGQKMKHVVYLISDTKKYLEMHWWSKV